MIKKVTKKVKAAWIAFRFPDLVYVKDYLTGALSKGEFCRIAERVLIRAQKSREDVSLVYLDIDDLKSVNDAQGHGAGDSFLREFSKVVFASIRPFDIFARRYGDGGDEFILLLPGVKLDDVEKVIDRIQETFPSFSWGATELGNKYDELTSMLSGAERMMYGQKAAKAEEKKCHLGAGFAKESNSLEPGQ